jgi:Domain of unknown function (DUF4123)
MELNKQSSRAKLFALVDGAASPGALQPLLEGAGVGFRSVYAGLPEETLGAASLFLVPIDDPDAPWVTELDRIDLHSPCLSLVWGRVGAEQLVAHLRAFLFADIGDGMTAMVRFFDPRNTGTVFRVWGDPILNIFMGPIERWMYRGRHPDWQRVENDSLTAARHCKSIKIELEQRDVDILTAHTEPDALLASLIDVGLVDGKRAYLDRFADFMPRYERALHWGLDEPTDRLSFCQQTYLHGMDFDRHPRVAAALEARRESRGRFRTMIEGVPTYIWDEIARKRDSQSRSSDNANN